MPTANLPEAITGLLLVFLVPGFTLTKALFPEWRVRGPEGLRRLVELVTLSFVLSVVLTVLVGYVWLVSLPGGFQASWSDPGVEATLAGISVVGFVAGYLRGAYRREAPPSPTVRGEPEADPFELTRLLDRLAREERRIQHELRVRVRDEHERGRLERRLEEIRAETAELARRQEASYAS
jgi:hypothetical protein